MEDSYSGNTLYLSEQALDWTIFFFEEGRGGSFLKLETRNTPRLNYFLYPSPLSRGKVGPSRIYLPEGEREGWGQKRGNLMGTERDPIRLMAKAADRTGLQTRPRLALHPAPIQARQGCDWEEAEIAKHFPGFFISSKV